MNVEQVEIPLRMSTKIIKMKIPMCKQQIMLSKIRLVRFGSELFQLRYENGYDLFIDPNYVSWLQLHHPESLPEHLSSSWNHDDMDLGTNLLDMDMDCSVPTNRYM